MTDRYCCWKDHTVKEMHITNKEVTVGFCPSCSEEIQRMIIHANVMAERKKMGRKD